METFLLKDSIIPSQFVRIPFIYWVLHHNYNLLLKISNNFYIFICFVVLMITIKIYIVNYISVYLIYHNLGELKIDCIYKLIILF